MEARVDFDINEAIKLFDSDPSTIPTPEAPRALQECEDDPEALSSLALINSELNPVVDAVAESPDAITRTEDQDAIPYHKNLLEMYAFLLRWTISAVETRALEKSASAPAARGRGKTGKAKGSSKDGSWDAAAQLETALD
nr:hypothetical protein [Tanacetum cinerariifolium]